MKKKSVSGFTLIELLVVISIIAVLMSIMMPALGRVREQGKDVVCKANLKQIHLGASLWSEDNDGYTVAGFWHAENEGVYANASLDSYLNANSDKQGDVYACPSAKNLKLSMDYMQQQHGIDGLRRISYGGNGYLYLSQEGPNGDFYSPGTMKPQEGFGAFGEDDVYAFKHGWMKIATAKGADHLMYFMDYGYYHVSTDGFNPTVPRNELESVTSWGCDTRWHGKKDSDGWGHANIAWLDGHVSKEPKDFAEKADSSNGHRHDRFWYYFVGLK